MVYQDLHDFLDTAWMVTNKPALLGLEDIQEFIKEAEEFRDARAAIGQTIPPTLARGIAFAKAELNKRV